MIELKAGIAKKEHFGQILSYIASVENANEGRKLRGLMVANDFDYALILASSKIPDLKLVKYTVKFDFEDV